jgi:hypothetical protein
MKTGFPIRDVAYATFQGILPVPVLYYFSSNQTFVPFSFNMEKIIDNGRRNGRQSDFSPNCLVLRVIRKSDHIDNTAFPRPPLRRREVVTGKKPLLAP